MDSPLVRPKPFLGGIEAWREAPYTERVRLGALDWAQNGFGAPITVYAFYVVKIAAYVLGWMAFVGAGDVGGTFDITSWWTETVAFQKAIIWTLLWEGLGLGAGSGPLTARYLPPVSAFLYFLRPGTVRLPTLGGRIPGTAGTTRSIVDVALYATLLGAGVSALLADAISTTHVWAMLVSAGLLSLRDQTVFLAIRGEHYLVTVAVFLFADDVIAGSKAVQYALWLGAAVSKLNHHFPSVIAVMTSNNAILRSPAIRRRLYRNVPDDLRPSTMSTWAAHLGTVVEFGFPLVLLLSSGGRITTVALVVMVIFHANIFLSMPVGVPLEWNVLFIYSGLLLFGHHADVSVLDIGDPVLAVILIVVCLGVPVFGNLVPSKVSFLPAMRYYAGNWPYSVWVFKDDALQRLHDTMPTLVREPLDQARTLYDEDVVTTLYARLMTFRVMHLQGRIVPELLPRLPADDTPLTEHDLREGEVVAGMLLGWNFGDGHLHQEALLDAVQERCGFGPGEVRCLFVEGQPLFGHTLAWRIVDAHDGRLEDGEAHVQDLLAMQPWPTRTEATT